MSLQDIKNIFQKLSLTEKEAKVYAALLELGMSGATQLAEKAKVTRPSVYTYLENLAHLRLVRKTKRGTLTLFTPESPQIVKRICQQKRTLLEQQLEDWETVENQFLNLLKGLSGEGAKDGSPGLRYFEGFEGIKDSYQHILDHAQGEVLSYFSSTGTETEELRKYLLDTYRPKRIEKKIFSKTIATQTERSQWYFDHQKELDMEVRFVSQSTIGLTNSEINMYGPFIHWMYFDERGGGATIANNQLMADEEKAKFQYMWQQVGKN